MLMINKGVWVS